jgi:hypothetical protein
MTLLAAAPERCLPLPNYVRVIAPCYVAQTLSYNF